MTEKEQQQLQMVREKLAKIKAKEQAILARDKKHQRELRTRRRIQIGMLAEKYFYKDITPLEFENIVKNFIELPSAKNYIEQFKKSEQ
ncbi:MAG: hypothetical protein FWD71_08870 [Oscillospiraceae bacterium]|nr:hypothetical protein [Oscillospiraceae bacterium]